MSASIVGWSHLPFGRLDKLSLEDLIVNAATEALSHAGLTGEPVDGIWLGNLNGGFTPDIFASSLALSADAGLRWKPAARLENHVLRVPRRCMRPAMPSSQDGRASRW